MQNCVDQDDPNKFSSCGTALEVVCGNAVRSALRMWGLKLVTAERTFVEKVSGRLEVKQNQRWGTVCDDMFGQKDAKVACGQLGLTGGVSLGNV